LLAPSRTRNDYNTARELLNEFTTPNKEVTDAIRSKLLDSINISEKTFVAKEKIKTENAMASMALKLPIILTYVTENEHSKAKDILYRMQISSTYSPIKDAVDQLVDDVDLIYTINNKLSELFHDHAKQRLTLNLTTGKQNTFIIESSTNAGVKVK